MKEVTYILIVKYDGTEYYGWQRQPDLPTIQGSLEEVLSRLWDSRINTIGASRTDAGVHSLGQCVSFPANRKFEPEDILKRANMMLPEDIAIDSVRITSERFHARFDAIKKRYRYKILTEKDPIQARFGWWLNIMMPSDDFLDILNRISGHIIGEHNFSAFSIIKDLPEKPICNISMAKWILQEKQIHFIIEGNRFIHKMVRSLVGAMLGVVRGKWSEQIFIDMLNRAERIIQYRVAPPQGLILERVYY